MKKEVANNDDVSDVDDVDLECRWHSTYNSADRGNREVAEKISISAAKKVDLDINMPANANALVTRNRSAVPHFTLQKGYDSSTEENDLSVFSQNAFLLKNVVYKRSRLRSGRKHGNQIPIKIRN